MRTAILTLVFGCFIQTSFGQRIPKESDYYEMVTLPVPEGMLFEVGGITTLPDGRIALATRRGHVYLVDNAYMAQGKAPQYTLFASGLHEPLGLLYHQGALYTAQRGELTKLIDTNADDKADRYETVHAWPLSGHYHEYSFGPKLAPDGSFFVTGNVAFGSEEWWRAESRVPMRGWTMKISEDGHMEPWASGMRSPAGLGMIDGELFYDDNQGDWVGSGAIWHLQKGTVSAHPAGLVWSDRSDSPITMTNKEFLDTYDERRVRKNGRAVKPENIPNEENPLTMYEARKKFPEITLPAVWLPHGVLGISNSEILKDDTQGGFGPFAGQIFVGDQGQSKIMRVVMEKVNGAFQGVAFDFRTDFQSGVLRMNWGADGSLFVGETNRGWGSAGSKNSGLERLVWTGEVPMEMKTVSARPDGFEIEFTKPVNRETAENLDSYSGKSFTYKYHSVYGSPTIMETPLDIKGVKVSDDGLKARIVVGNLTQFHIHQLEVKGIRSQQEGHPVLHPVAYYTLNHIPDGAKLPASEWSTKRSKKKKAAPKAVAAKTVKKKSKKAVPTDEEIQSLLAKNTCVACHNREKRQIGPSFKAISERRYTNAKIVDLIYNPVPSNWPDYPTPMAPMTQVPKAEAQQIAAWINSLRSGD
ncbi:hypothetical protein [Sediminicola luteus]|uniref:Cytochrome c domain-containing protein n=1 Tax=Sediminicola luteus TaxID=319238 RepID=A0A2A4GFM7_9FLAO|nr:hypothetical protein [Sediminicola luteus]PCE66778.1 hypothetical protein B7P33_03445 [Sediminicola luteus]